MVTVERFTEWYSNIFFGVFSIVMVLRHYSDVLFFSNSGHTTLP